MSLLDSDESAPDVNTIDGFTAALEQAVNKGREAAPATTEGQLEGLSDGVKAGLTIPGEAAPEGDPPAEATPPEAAPETVATPAGETPAFDDPKVAALVERYGSIEAALAAAVEAQSLLGRQGNELGELRQRLDALESPPEPAAAPAPQVLITEEIRDGLADAVAQNGGQETVVWAIQNNPGLYDAAIDAWDAAEREEAEVNGTRPRGEARKFDREFTREVARIEALREAEAAAPAAPEPANAEAQVSDLRASIEVVKAATPDWAAVEPLLDETLKSSPQVVKDLIASPDATQREEGLTILAGLARGKLTAATAVAIAGAGGDKSGREAALIAAGVGAGSLSPGTPETDESQREDAIAKWKQDVFLNPKRGR